MKLITNNDNIDALKIAIVANEAKEPLEIIQSEGGLLPCLVDEKSYLKLFVSNAACCYIHEHSGWLKKEEIGAVEGKKLATA